MTVMVNTKLNLSMTEPYVRQIYAKQGDTGRVLEIGLEDALPENGTLRILRPDGLEKTSDAVSSDSPTITDGMASFDSLDEADVTSLKVGISPVQDLHGYANPWVGGAGKNKYSGSNITTTGFYTYQFPTPLPAGTYTVSALLVSTTTGQCDVRFRRQDTSQIITCRLTPNSGHRASATVTLDEPAYYAYFYQSTSTSGYEATWSDIQIEQGSTATSYAPYTNICPIYGHTDINVYQVGKNLWTSSWEQGVWDTSGNKGASTVVVRTSERIRVIPLQHYAIRRSVYTSYVNVRCFAKDGTYLGTGGDYITLIRGASAGATNANPMQSNEAWCVIQPNKDVYYVAFNDFSNDLNTEYMMVIGDTVPNEYVPFVAPNTYPVSLGQSVYGGTLDVVGGKLTITHGVFSSSNANDFSTNGETSYYVRTAVITPPAYAESPATNVIRVISNKFKGVGGTSASERGVCFLNWQGAIRFNTVDSYASVSDMITAIGEIQFVYELATPLEVDLTPTQITTLLGTNNMWADGEISELTFDYGKLLSVLTADQTEVVGRCLGDVNFGGASTMPFTLIVIPNNQEETP